MAFVSKKIKIKLPPLMVPEDLHRGQLLFFDLYMTSDFHGSSL